MNPPFNHADFRTKRVGVDEAAGRWYRGAISKEQAKRATAANALEILSDLHGHFYGGSHFDTNGARSTVPLEPEML